MKKLFVLGMWLTQACPCNAGAYDARYILQMIVEMSVYSEKCGLYRNWMPDWEKLENVAAGYKISFDILDPHGPEAPMINAARTQISDEFERGGRARCDFTVRRYGPSGSFLPGMLKPVTDRQMQIEPEPSLPLK